MLKSPQFLESPGFAGTAGVGAAVVSGGAGAAVVVGAVVEGAAVVAVVAAGAGAEVVVGGGGGVVVVVARKVVVLLTVVVGAMVVVVDVVAATVVVDASVVAGGRVDVPTGVDVVESDNGATTVSVSALASSMLVMSDVVSEEVHPAAPIKASEIPRDTTSHNRRRDFDTDKCSPNFRWNARKQLNGVASSDIYRMITEFLF